MITCKDETQADASQFGASVSARVLEDTPRVLSVDRLVNEHGAKFEWDSNAPRLFLDGVWTQLPVKSGVPFLGVPAVSRST